MTWIAWLTATIPSWKSFPIFFNVNPIVSARSTTMLMDENLTTAVEGE
jgi:hypothetical protein